MPGREDYEARRQARIDRLRAAEGRARERSDAEYKRSHDLVKDIPLGQPNIIGRPGLPNLRAKSMRAMDRSLEQDRKAEYYAGRAEAAENNTAISSDDPDAIEKLEAKIAELESQQQRMKAINKYYRKHKTCVGFEGLSDKEAKKLDKQKEAGYPWETAPYPSYELSSVNRKIKDAKARIEKLRKIDAMPAEIIEFGHGEIESDPETNRIIIRFDERQGEDMVTALKSNGFRWTPSMTAWTRQRNQNALRAAKRICGIE